MEPYCKQGLSFQPGTFTLLLTNIKNSVRQEGFLCVEYHRLEIKPFLSCQESFSYNSKELLLH